MSKNKARLDPLIITHPLLMSPPILLNTLGRSILFELFHSTIPLLNPLFLLVLLFPPPQRRATSRFRRHRPTRPMTRRLAAMTALTLQRFLTGMALQRAVARRHRLGNWLLTWVAFEWAAAGRGSAGCGATRSGFSRAAPTTRVLPSVIVGSCQLVFQICHLLLQG